MSIAAVFRNTIIWIVQLKIICYGKPVILVLVLEHPDRLKWHVYPLLLPVL